MLHPQMDPKNGRRNEHAALSMSSCPARASHKSAPHVFVTVLLLMLTMVITLSGVDKIPLDGQRSQVAGNSESDTNSSMVDRSAIALVGIPVVAIDGSIVTEEDGTTEEIAVGTLDGSILVVVEDGSAEETLVGTVDGWKDVVEESFADDGSGVSIFETNASIVGGKVGKGLRKSPLSAVLSTPGSHPPQ